MHCSETCTETSAPPVADTTILLLICRSRAGVVVVPVNGLLFARFRSSTSVLAARYPASNMKPPRQSVAPWPYRPSVHDFEISRKRPSREHAQSTQRSFGSSCIVGMFSRGSNSTRRINSESNKRTHMHALPFSTLPQPSIYNIHTVEALSRQNSMMDPARAKNNIQKTKSTAEAGLRRRNWRHKMDLFVLVVAGGKILAFMRFGLRTGGFSFPLAKKKHTYCTRPPFLLHPRARR